LSTSKLRTLARQIRLWRRQSAFMYATRRPWVRFRIQWAFLRRDAHIAAPFYGPILQALHQGRLEVGPGVRLMPGCWITAPGEARVNIGRHTYLNLGCTIAAYEEVRIGQHCMFANGCFVTDADHRYDDPRTPMYEQGYRVKGPTIIGDNVWCGVNVVVLGGVTVGDHCVIGANSVVTHDIEPFSVAAGIPAQVIRKIPSNGAASP
jgi:acetyltransferase-like isoleucine patch superfamily enzyme